MGTSSASSGSMVGPMIATGTISGLRSGGNPEMELRLRPQSNGFLHGELVIHQSGFGMTPLDGYVRGNQLQFQVPYGTETYYFEGSAPGRSDQRHLRINAVRRTRHLDHPDELSRGDRCHPVLYKTKMRSCGS